MGKEAEHQIKRVCFSLGKFYGIRYDEANFAFDPNIPSELPFRARAKVNTCKIEIFILA
jgi:hypothetical protein